MTRRELDSKKWLQENLTVKMTTRELDSKKMTTIENLTVKNDCKRTWQYKKMERREHDSKKWLQ